MSDAEPIRLNYGERMRIVLVNDTMMTHTIHLHGMWSDLEDEQGQHLVRKHTIDMPPGSKRSYRVRAATLGSWTYPCPLLYHMEDGIMRQVTVEDCAPDHCRSRHCAWQRLRCRSFLHREPRPFPP